jgi:glutamate-1-semialdehyde 2,1-aminomutase
MLELLRQLTTQHGALLIFDEVLSSFRMAAGGAQEFYGVTPDLCTLAKAVANGLPLAVVAGRREYMQVLSPLGPAAHSGTYSGHLFAVLAALASLGEITQPGFYDRIFANADRLYAGLTALFDRHEVPARVQGLGARFGIYFGVTTEVTNYQDAARIDGELGLRFIRACFERGVYFHNYGKLALGHHGFSAAHTPADIDETLGRVEDALKAMRAA